MQPSEQIGKAISLAQSLSRLGSSEQRYRELVEGLKVVVVEGDIAAWQGEPSSWKMSFVSHQVENLLKFPVERWLQEPGFFASRLHPDDRSRVIGEIQDYFHYRGDGYTEFRMLDADDKPVWIQIVAHPLESEREDRGVFHAVLTDITPRKKAEEELKKTEEKYLQAQKMEAIGRLAGGVAHDFNNMLTLILGYSDIAMQDLEKNDPLRTFLKEIHKAGERSAALTQQLLAFSRKQIMEMKVLDLNAHVREMDKMLRRIIGEDVHYQTLLAEDPPVIRADPGQLNQVIMNLAINARDAMPTGGRLILRTSRLVLDKPERRGLEVVPPGPYVCLEMADTGSGIDAETLAHIFEPFFTTKGSGKGTGLGLPTVYGIVTQSNGFIDVASQPGLGTTFRILLPEVAQAVPTIVKKEGPKPALGGKERILLVEDEDGVRKLLTGILEGHGYQVTSAANAGEALLLCEQAKKPFALLVTDVVMPHLMGHQLAERLTPLQPGMKTLFISGYADEKFHDHGFVRQGHVLLNKPFTPENLLAKVREVLGC